MGKGLNALLGIIIVGFLLVASGVFYTVDETQQVIITQFGKLVGQPQKEAGLYFKIPFVQKANYFEKRVLEWDGDANQIPTREKRLIWVDTTARWRIEDPLKFFQSVRSELSAQSRLDDIIDASTRDIISSHTLAEVIRNSNRLLDKEQQTVDESQKYEFGRTKLETIKSGREALQQKILERAVPTVKDYGIELVDMRIKRINYVQEVRTKVYERMVSERKRAAEQFRSEGQGKKAEIEGQMGKELQEIRAEAYRKAEEIKGKADAEAIKIYADAYNKDSEFYSFVKTLDTYKRTMNKDTTLILSTDNEFYNQLNGSDVKGQ